LEELISLRNGLKTPGAITSPSPIRCSIISLPPGAPCSKDCLRGIETNQLDVLPFAEGEREHVMSIALGDNSGWEEVLIVDPKNGEDSERAALKRLTAIFASATRM